MNENVKTQTVDIKDEDYKPMPGEVFFHKVETDRRKYMISLRKQKDGVTIVIGDQLKQDETQIEEKQKRVIHRIRIYDEAVDEFVNGFEQLITKYRLNKR